MATVPDIRTARKSPIRHYAFLGETPGIATLVPGGYSFRPDDGRPTRLGPAIVVRLGNRAWRVPRHYIALHGLKAWELTTLGFPEAER